MRLKLALMLAGCSFAATPKIAVPLYFELNTGQTDAQVSYLAHSAKSTVWLTRDGAVLGVGGKSKQAVLKLRFDGGNRAAKIEAEDRGGTSNYFLGNDPAKWRRDIPQFA